MCENKDKMNFDHNSLNELIGIDADEMIPYVCIDNPLVYVLKAKESMKGTKIAALNATVL